MIALPVRFLALPLVATATLAGLWVSGAVITNDFTVSMWLTAAWMAVAGLGAFAVALRRRPWRWPVLGGYALAALIAGALLAPSVLFDDVVHEDVAVAAPAPPAATSSRSSAAAPEPKAARNVLLRAGRLEAVRHGARGDARLIRLTNGRRVVTLTGFAVANGPDLRLYLVPGRPRGEGDVDEVVDLGALKSNRGDQQYRIPAGTELRGPWTVVVWCRAFSVLFARAELR